MQNIDVVHVMDDDTGDRWCLTTAGLMLVAQSTLDGTIPDATPAARVQAQTFLDGIFDAAGQFGAFDCEQLRATLQHNRSDTGLMPMLLDAVVAAGPEAVSAVWIALIAPGTGNEQQQRIPQTRLAAVAIDAMDSDLFQPEAGQEVRQGVLV
jgi:hypothetical protein